MSRVFGEISQIAYITRDLDAALEFFLKSGIGPWYVSKRRMMNDVDYRGARVDIEISVAVANSGSLQLEVIEQTNDAKTIYTEWLDRNPGQLIVQHMSSWPVDFHETEQRILAAGYKAVMAAVLPGGPFAYYEHPDHPEFVFETSELNARRRYIWETVAAGARNWDGKDPIRAFPVPR